MRGAEANDVTDTTQVVQRLPSIWGPENEGDQNRAKGVLC